MTFIPNPDFAREFNNELEVKANMLRIAEEVKVVVEQGAPEGPTHDYHNSIVAGEDELGAYLATKDFAGHLIEWGSVNNEVFAPIRRGVVSAGLHLTQIPKP